MLNIEKIKQELEELCKRGVPHIGMIEYILERYIGQESIPTEILLYAMECQPEISIIKGGCHA